LKREAKGETEGDITARSENLPEEVRPLLEIIPKNERPRIMALLVNIRKAEERQSLGDLAKLEELHPGYIEWSQKITEIEQAANIRLREKLIDGGISNEAAKRANERMEIETHGKYSLRGQMLGFFAFIILIIFIGICLYWGYEKTALAALGIGTVGMVVKFLDNHFSRKVR